MKRPLPPLLQELLRVVGKRMMRDPRAMIEGVPSKGEEEEEEAAAEEEDGHHRPKTAAAEASVVVVVVVGRARVKDWVIYW